MFYVYLLQCDNYTYIGATVNLDRRLRQHNKEIKGGAKLTGSKVSNGSTWKRLAYVEGFPTWNSALQFEWKWKNISKKYSNDLVPLEKRIVGLINLLELEKPTKKSIEFSEWNIPPKIIFEDKITEELFIDLLGI